MGYFARSGGLWWRTWPMDGDGNLGKGGVAEDENHNDGDADHAKPTPACTFFASARATAGQEKDSMRENGL